MNSTFQQFDLTGKSAFITSADTALGYSAAKALAEAGAILTISGEDKEALDQAASQLASEAGCQPASTIRLKLRDAEAAQTVTKALGDIDIFVGIASPALSAETKTGNVTDNTPALARANTLITLASTLLPGMRNRQWGRIIFCASEKVISDTQFPFNNLANASAEEGALSGFARMLGGDTGPDNVTVNCINPGILETGNNKDTDEHEIPQALKDQIPLRRGGCASDIEGLVQLLASEAGSYMTCSKFTVDGGISFVMGPHQLGTPS